jgi:hypothetical protein
MGSSKKKKYGQLGKINIQFNILHLRFQFLMHRHWFTTELKFKKCKQTLLAKHE